MLIRENVGSDAASS